MKIIFILILVLILCVLYVRYLEGHSIFFPSRQMIGNPMDMGLSFEDVFITTEDKVKIHGWFIPSSVSSDKILLFFHGNAGNISGRLEKIKMFYDMGLSVFIIDYRGYGKSEGQPTEEGVYKDALAAYDYIIQREEGRHKEIIIYGASLGGAIAVDLASKRKADYLIVDSSFTNAVDMAKRIFPWVPSVLIKTQLNSLEKIQKIPSAKLFIHSREDEVVPFALGQKLYDAALKPKEFLEIRGGHNDGHIYDEDKFETGVKKFLKL